MADAWKNVMRNRRRSLTAMLITAFGSAAVLASGGFALFTFVKKGTVMTAPKLLKMVPHPLINKANPSKGGIRTPKILQSHLLLTPKEITLYSLLPLNPRP